MIKPNWDIFKAKFSENPQNNFEWFCYLLFCKEFNKPIGIFRYTNQSAIETDPIKTEDSIIGWQAKFYDTPLSKHKKDLENNIEKAKRDYPDISKIIFYTNKEWGQNRGKEPQSKIDVEKKGREYDIDLVWRTASFFESEFVTKENDVISRHFFNLEKSVFNLIEKQQTHIENILDEIHTGIAFSSCRIEIDRASNLEDLTKSLQKVIILSGVAGVGKTALIKIFYEKTKEKIPFYIFKATEFELRNIYELFTDADLPDFIQFHKDYKNKIVVIDSAEKLLDLKNIDPFKEFLSVLLKNKWKIIFTTRKNYLEDLNFQFFEIYKIVPLNINIQDLSSEELNSISDQYNFSLPNDQKLFELIKNPFYLNEYLKFYKKDEELDYVGFKDKLWNKVIKKSKSAREQCFLKIAFERANSGQFFINPDCDQHILDNDLKYDGIIGYESPHGYFITHDIYEEWALEKIIGIEFNKKTDTQAFLNNIGVSLPIRRAFRNWISEKLMLEEQEINNFIEEVIEDKEIESFWKDEVLISILLSNYSDTFFDIFKDELLLEEQTLLKKLTFLLRIACKEVDGDIFKQLGIKNINLFSLNYVFTKPKGHGWKSLIKFTFEHIDEIGVQNIYFILPIIYDWNSKFKDGQTTRFSSLLALKYYECTIKEDIYFSRDDKKDHLIQTILYGTSEIKNEFEKILDNVLKYKWKYHRDPYHDLSKAILTRMDAIAVYQALPKYVLQLADLFWTYTPKEDDFYHSPRMEIEEDFGIEYDHQDYYPASTYQTPIRWLLQYALKETINFILEFTNKTVECFAKSEFAKNEVWEIKVHLEEGKSKKQYICNRLWCIYRGSQVAPDVLESIHMALERFFLDHGKNTDSSTLEWWLIYLLKNTISASITAVVTSIVLAYPEKTFNVAKILFKTKEFFLFDTNRLSLDQTQKSSLLGLKNMYLGLNYKNEIHENERIKACDDSHRQWYLETLFFNYQIFRSEETSEEEAKKRQSFLWGILDNYYSELPNKSDETDSDKAWRLCLARMDRRIMKPTTEKTDKGTIINWNPEIDPELREFSEKSLEKSSEPMKHISLKLWANLKFINDDKYKEYEQYEKNPKLVIKEVKEIIQKLKTIKSPDHSDPFSMKADTFYLFNYSIPSYACSVLIRDHIKDLSKKEKEFCKKIILEAASTPIEKNYQYQIGDGTQPAIYTLSILFDNLLEGKENIKKILLMNLFNDYPIGMGGDNFHHFAIIAIHKLWDKHFREAQSLLFGYLKLKPKFEDLWQRVRKENIKKGIYNKVNKNQIIEVFLEENKADIKKVVDNNILIDDLDDIKKIELYFLNVAFKLIPLKTENKEHKELVNNIIPVFVEKLLSYDRDDRVDYKVRHEFLEKLAYFILNAPKEEIAVYLNPFLDNFGGYQSIADFFKIFVSAEDYTDSYENFWHVWELFKNKIIVLCKNGDRYAHISEIVKSYLFAMNPWKETATEWHTFKTKDKRFLKKISEEIGHCPSCLFAISKLLNGIGSTYMNDGVAWISGMLINNKNELSKKLETDTVYYLENIIRKYVYKNREKIRKTIKLKQDVLNILDFLIEEGSVIGYMSREYIL